MATLCLEEEILGSKEKGRRTSLVQRFSLRNDKPESSKPWRTEREMPKRSQQVERSL